MVSVAPPPEEDLDDPADEDEVDRGGGSLTKAEQLEVERFCNEAFAEMRRGMPWWVAWATANEPLPDDFGPEDPPVVVETTTAVAKEDPLRALFSGGPSTLPPVDVRPWSTDVERFYPERPEPKLAQIWERAEQTRREHAARGPGRRGRRRGSVILAEGRHGTAQDANGQRPASLESLGGPPAAAPASLPPGSAARPLPGAAAEGPRTSGGDRTAASRMARVSAAPGASGGEQSLDRAPAASPEEPTQPQPAARAATLRSTPMPSYDAILEALKEEPLTPSQLAEYFGEVRSRVDTALWQMKKKGLVVNDGKGTPYRLTGSKTPKSVDELAEKRAAGEALNGAFDKPKKGRKTKKVKASRKTPAPAVDEASGIADAVEIPAAPCQRGEHDGAFDVLLERRAKLVSEVAAKVAAIDGAIRACIG